MATILEQYRKRQNEIREQIAANSLPLDQMLIMQELNYRICVLETFESLCKSAPVTMDTKKEVFRCPRCGASGGIFDLYALYTGIPRDEVRKAILAQLGVPENASRPRQKILPKADTECPLTDIDARHATYLLV